MLARAPRPGYSLDPERLPLAFTQSMSAPAWLTVAP